MSTGHTDPIGGTGAVRLTDTGSGTVVALRSGTDTDTSFAAGGRYVIAGWINSPDAAFNPALLFQFFGGSDLVWTSTQNTVLPAMWYFACPAAIGGWQHVVMSDTLVSGSASQSYDVRIAGPLPATSKYMDVFGLSAFWIPPTVNENDAAEFIGTLKAQPHYLAAGMAGTFENQKLIAHGGMGIDATVPKVAGAGSGQLTIGSIVSYEPRYAANGTTIIGWAPLYGATVNP
jgi:hypothetical protein